MKEFLRCLLLPIHQQTLIVPYAAIAEIIPFSTPIPIANAPKWLIGTLDWRDIQLPLIALEIINDTHFDLLVKPNLHIAIFNRILETSALDFFGLVLQGVPNMSRFKKADIQFIAEPKDPHLIMEAKARTLPVLIPNIKRLEEKIITESPHF